MKYLVFICALPILYLVLIRPGKRREEAWEPFAGRLYAHRGLHDNTMGPPENTLKAFQRAVDAGYGIELDVQMTKDHQAVVFHDFAGTRILRDPQGRPVNGKIRSYTYEELQNFHILESAERIPLFKDVLRVIDGRVPLIVELKIETADLKPEVCEKADALLGEYNGPYIIESFHPIGVYWYRKHRPEILRGQLSESFTKKKNVPYTQKPVHWMMEYMIFNLFTGPDFIAYNRKHTKNLSRRLCRDLYHCKGAAWTVKNEKQLKEAKKDYDLYIFDSFVPKA